MNIDLKIIKISALFENYQDSGESGVSGYNGKLNIRPPYQREFVYQQQQRDEVIHTIMKGFPLNSMYWAVADDHFELMDGQQRTISICRYVAGDFSIQIDNKQYYYHNLTHDKKKIIDDYQLYIYVCQGTESEKLDWFKVINIAGEKLTDQELRNAIYTGTWLSNAKVYFSKSGAPAAQISDKYVSGSPIRQELLEKALHWISNGNIEKYMSEHQHDPNALALWQYFQSIITWVKGTFTTYRKEMKSVDWGILYNSYKDKILDTNKLEQEISFLMQDEDVSKKSGIYSYVLTGNERHLNIRAFSDKHKREAFERQNAICPVCNKQFNINEMEADHIKPWHEGGKTITENCQMLCKMDNRLKSGR